MEEIVIPEMDADRTYSDVNLDNSLEIEPLTAGDAVKSNILGTTVVVAAIGVGVGAWYGARRFLTSRKNKKVVTEIVYVERPVAEEEQTPEVKEEEPKTEKK